MKPEAQIKALAELDGWKQHPTFLDIMIRGNQEAHIESANLQQYFISYDAIIPLIQKQNVEVKQWIHNSNFGDFHYDKTPSQLCEALLRSVGKWKD